MKTRNITVVTALIVAALGIHRLDLHGLSASQDSVSSVETKKDSIQPSQGVQLRLPGRLGTRVHGGDDLEEVVREELVKMVTESAVPPDRVRMFEDFFWSHPDLQFDGWGLSIREVQETRGSFTVTFDVSPLVSSAHGAGSLSVNGGVRETYISDGLGGLHLIELNSNSPMSIFRD